MDTEIFMDVAILADLCVVEQDQTENRSLWMQIESDVLLSALKVLNTREQAVLFARVLEEKTSRQVAAQLDMSSVGAAAVYYRALQKLRKQMRAQDR